MDLGPNPPIRWEVVKFVGLYNPGSKSCKLCLAEKVAICRLSGPNCLNKRTELAQAVDTEPAINSDFSFKPEDPPLR